MPADIRQNVIINLLVKNVKGFGRSMIAPLQTMKQMNRATDGIRGSIKRVTNTGARWGFTLRNMTHGMRGFRMEMLGVMFFGMGMQKFFTGLLKPAMETVGIFQLWSTVLQVMFLPIAFKLLEFLMPLFMWFMNLPEGVQTVIGVIVLLGAALGTLLFLFGMFALGIGSVILALDVIIPVISALLSVGLWPLIAVIGIVIAAVLLLYLAFKTNFAGIREFFAGVWESIVNILKGAWNIISGIWDIIAGVFTMDWKRVWEGVKKVFTGVWEIIVKGLGKLVWEIIKFLGRIIVAVIKWSAEFIAWIIKSIIYLATHTDEWVPKLVEAVKTAFQKIKDLAAELGKAIMDSIVGAIKGAWNWAKGLFGGGDTDTDIPKTARGGIVNRPQVRMIGEAGPEAIVPLGAAGTGFGGNITINNNLTVSSMLDIDEVVRVVSSELSEVLERDMSRVRA